MTHQTSAHLAIQFNNLTVSLKTSLSILYNGVSVRCAVCNSTCSLSTATSETTSSLSRVPPSAWDRRQWTFMVWLAACTIQQFTHTHNHTSLTTNRHSYQLHYIILLVPRFFFTVCWTCNIKAIWLFFNLQQWSRSSHQVSSHCLKTYAISLSPF